MAIALVVLAFLSIGHSMVIDFRTHFILQREKKINGSYVQSDLQGAAASPSGGLYLSFTHFHGPIIGYTINFYFRDVYVLYPQRVLVGDPSVPINTAPQLMAANLPPDDEWLAQHGISNILQYDYTGISIVPYIRHIGSR